MSRGSEGHRCLNHIRCTYAQRLCHARLPEVMYSFMRILKNSQSCVTFIYAHLVYIHARCCYVRLCFVLAMTSLCNLCPGSVSVLYIFSQDCVVSVPAREMVLSFAPTHAYKPPSQWPRQETCHNGSPNTSAASKT
jgi:hypothetical protein